MLPIKLINKYGNWSFVFGTIHIHEMNVLVTIPLRNSAWTLWNSAKLIKSCYTEIHRDHTENHEENPRRSVSHINSIRMTFLFYTQ